MTAASVALYNQWRDLMRSWGFTVLEAAGCDTQSASTRAANPGGMFVEHHDASSALSGNWGSLATILAGRVDVPPRLANLQFARDGQVVITCKNVANHGGLGGPLLGVPLNDVNVRSCGAEVANNGLGEPYSPALTRAIVHGEAAWAIVTGRTADYVRGHKEWAPTRKTDPVLDMNARRAAVAAVITNRGPLPGDLEDDEMDAQTRNEIAATNENVNQIRSYLGILAAKIDQVGAHVGAPADVDEAALAKMLTPLLASQTGALTSTDLQAIATAVADEQARRQAS